MKKTPSKVQKDKDQLIKEWAESKDFENTHKRADGKKLNMKQL